VTLASVLTPAANGPIVSVAFCGWGGGRSNLGRDEEADRWAWFIRKIFRFFKRKNPLLWPKATRRLYGHEADITVALMSVVEAGPASRTVIHAGLRQLGGFI